MCLCVYMSVHICLYVSVHVRTYVSMCLSMCEVPVYQNGSTIQFCHCQLHCILKLVVYVYIRIQTYLL